MKFFSFLLLAGSAIFSATNLAGQPAFQIVPLGVKGGGDESNLSAYLLAEANTNEYICLDAGTIRAGIERAIALNTFSVPESVVLRTYIKAYFISHGHLDHLSGMVLNSPDDTAKTIYAFPFVIEALKEKYFSWKSWANFGEEGEPPALKKYHYAALDSGKDFAIGTTSLQAKAFVLSHAAPYQSSALLVRHGDKAVLYLGDTGADSIEHSSRLRQLWESIAPLVRSGNLKGIFIETSFPDEQPAKQLFGHLTPQLLMQEMQVLARYTGNDHALIDLPVIITHRKPVGHNEEIIRQQLLKNNPLKLKLIFPEQGRKFYL